MDSLLAKWGAVDYASYPLLEAAQFIELSRPLLDLHPNDLFLSDFLEGHPALPSEYAGSPKVLVDSAYSSESIAFSRSVLSQLMKIVRDQRDLLAFASWAPQDSELDYVRTCLSRAEPGSTKELRFFVGVVDRLAPSVFVPFKKRGHPESARHEACMSIKKSGEVASLSTFLLDVMRARFPQDINQCDKYDVGAGQGYTSLELIRQGARRVVAVERSECQVHGNVQRAKGGGLSVVIDDETAARRTSSEHVGKETDLVVLHHDVGENSTFQQLLECGGRGASTDPAVLYSLHACGPLSDAMVAMFATDPRCALLANVGCCYNLIKEGTCPRSQSLRVNHGIRPFSRNMLMAACQAPRRWNETERETDAATRKRSRTEDDLPDAQCSDAPFLSQLFDRALLQVCLFRCGLLSTEHTVRHKPQKSSQSSQGESLPKHVQFAAYFAKAAEKVRSRGDNGPPALPPPPVDAAQLYCTAVKQGLPLLFSSFFTLKAVAAQIVEMLILIDRCHSIQELSSKSGAMPSLVASLVPLFDVASSPRNICIFGWRV